MRLFLIFITFFCFTSTYAQTKVFISSLSTANTDQLVSYFDDKLELSTPQNKGLYSKQQAKIILKQFFIKYPPKEYIHKHKGGSEERSLYEIGKLVSEQNNFRTYILYNIVQDKPQIIELRIENE